MKVSVKSTTTGGDRLERLVREARRAGVPSIDVGFFSTARYQDGTPVAAVAAAHEFGVRLREGGQEIPERPFFRQAIARIERRLPDMLASQIVNGQVEPGVAGRIGAWAAGEVQASIVRLREPPNSPATIARKGSSNPLIDTGHMRQSVTWRVNNDVVGG